MKMNLTLGALAAAMLIGGGTAEAGSRYYSSGHSYHGYAPAVVPGRGYCPPPVVVRPVTQCQTTVTRGYAPHRGYVESRTTTCYPARPIYRPVPVRRCYTRPPAVYYPSAAPYVRGRSCGSGGSLTIRF